MYSLFGFFLEAEKQLLSKVLKTKSAETFLHSFQDLLRQNDATIGIHVEMSEIWFLPNIEAPLRAAEIYSGVRPSPIENN